MNQAQVSVNIFNHIQQPTLVLDHEGRVVIWNDSIAEYTGVAAGDIMGKGSYAHAKVLFGERRPTLANYILAQSDPGSDYYRLLAHEGEGLLAESRIPLVSGKKVACMATPLYDPAGGQIGALETIRDISEERTGRMSPGTSEEEIQILARSLPDMIFKLDRDGVFLRFLWTGGQEMGIDPAEITGRTPHALFPEEEADFLSGAARRVIESEEAISETRSFLWHGKQRSFQITIHPLHDATGETTAAARGRPRHHEGPLTTNGPSRRPTSSPASTSTCSAPISTTPAWLRRPSSRCSGNVSPARRQSSPRGLRIRSSRGSMSSRMLNS
ncbi:MAG: PAS domain-containing protein [Candidatus Methanoculleus thermohydrogenotrophicum]